MEDLYEKHLYVLILCGGSGKRLWPRSRDKAPKQFIKLFGNKTIFQDTFVRSKRFAPASRIYVITTEDYVDEVKAQASDIPAKNIIAEPKGKNTALAMGFGATYIHNVDPMAIVVNFASDHHVSNLGKFDRAVKAAAKVANMGDYLVTIGVKPTFPHTGMGYIKVSHLFRHIDSSAAYVVERFIEKPDISTAGRFLSDGGYYWNANLYTWRADSILRAFEQYMPEMMRQLEKIRQSLGTAVEKRVVRKVYEEAQEISIDYAISEKAKNLVLIPSTFSWSDIGDWKVAYDVSKKNNEGNVVIFEKGKGDFLSVDTKDCLIHFSDQLVATIGVKDLIIVDTKDALLVAKKDRAQDVKTLVNELIAQKKTKYI